MFLIYEEEKRRLDAYDISDLIHHIWTQLHKAPGGYCGPHIDSIFVDETQDFTSAELRLFIRICRDKNDMVPPASERSPGAQSRVASDSDLCSICWTVFQR